jgi:hypothetical protein
MKPEDKMKGGTALRTAYIKEEKTKKIDQQSEVKKKEKEIPETRVRVFI